MSARFEKWASQFRIGWAGERGAAWLGAAGKLIGDRAEQWGVYALRQGLPEYAEIANAKAIGAERGIEPGPLLSDADAAKLVRCARTINRFRGTPLGLAVALYYADFHDFVILTQNGLSWSITGTPDLDDLESAESDGLPAWMTKTDHSGANPPIPASADGKPAIAPYTIPWYPLGPGPMDSEGNQYTSRFAVAFPTGVTPGGSTLATAANLDRIRRVIREWRDAKATCTYVCVCDTGVWDDGVGTWDDGIGTWNDGTFAEYSA